MPFDVRRWMFFWLHGERVASGRVREYVLNISKSRTGGHQLLVGLAFKKEKGLRVFSRIASLRRFPLSPSAETTL